ncbi:MAG TPA: hypothetical protein VMV72_13965 [Verrucomicrobiae bacterium]|nr:hypothetical protein [Verrucomicrobiae bacterium]
MKTDGHLPQTRFPARCPTICLILVAAISGAVGFYSGRNSFSPAGHGEIAPIPPDSAPVESKTQQAPAPSKIIVPRDAPPATDKPDEQWNKLTSQPRTRMRDNQILAAIEDFAARDPKRAVALALAQTDLRQRLDMLRAALRGWARSDPDAAGDWAFSHQPIIDKCDAATAVLTGAINNPDAAIRLFSRLSQIDPTKTRELGDSLIAAWSNNGDFSRAVAFAAQGDSPYRTEWLAAAFGEWSEYQPQTAVAEAMKLPNPDSRQSAVQSALARWAQHDPQGLAEYSLSLPEGQDKSAALTESLPSWAVNDPAAAAEWMNQQPSSPELDQGIATVARSFDGKPEVAVSWAESIANSQLRSRTLATIVRRWNDSDPAAARQYILTSTNLVAEDRSELLTGLGGDN